MEKSKYIAIIRVKSVMNIEGKKGLLRKQKKEKIIIQMI